VMTCCMAIFWSDRSGGCDRVVELWSWRVLGLTEIQGVGNCGCILKAQRKCDVILVAERWSPLSFCKRVSIWVAFTFPNTSTSFPSHSFHLSLPSLSLRRVVWRLFHDKPECIQLRRNSRHTQRILRSISKPLVFLSWSFHLVICVAGYFSFPAIFVLSNM